MSDFQGQKTRLLWNEHLKLEFLENSIRIVRFYPFRKENIFAEVKANPVSTPFGDFYFRGGHRLWHAPESMPRTYIPDNEGAVVSEIRNGVRIEMPPEPWTYIGKAIEIELHPDKPQIKLRHELRNEGPWDIEFAPWALTMFKLGGVGIFPQPVGNVDDAGLLANRRFSIWPYAQIQDPRLMLRDDFILVHALPNVPPLKFGYFNPHGWIGYWLDGVLIIKHISTREDVQYPDNGCNVESYCNDEFIELESLGELRMVAPGQTVHHNELWELHDTLEVPYIPNEIQQIITSLIR